MSHMLKAFAALACASGAIFAASSAPLPKLTGPIPVASDSFPFLSAGRVFQPVDLKKAGYVEDEFIVSGTANVYDWAADGALTVKIPNAPYATRILIRHPADPARFSGNAVVELMNPARRFDWAMMSGYLRDTLMDRGDAWVGITMPGSVKTLATFNRARYAAATGFPNPDPSESCPATATDEDGLRWDMIAQVGAALKNGAGLNATHLYMTSQGADILTYINAIQPHVTLENGKPVYDGFLIKSPASLGRIRRCAPAPARGDARQAIRNAGVPVIQVVAQGEAAEDYRRPDSDEPNDRYRLYEVASAAHIDKWAYRDMASMQDQMAALGTPGQGTVDWPFSVRCDPEILLQAEPLQKYILDGAMVNLERWAREGLAPPKADRVSLKDGVGKGIAAGGVRSPQADFPMADYFTTTAGPGTCRELGRTVPFDWARLESLYGDHAKYAAKAAQEVDRMLREHWLTEADAGRIKAGL